MFAVVARVLPPEIEVFREYYRQSGGFGIGGGTRRGLATQRPLGIDRRESQECSTASRCHAGVAENHAVAAADPAGEE